MFTWLSRATEHNESLKDELSNIVNLNLFENKFKSSQSDEIPRINALLELLQTVLEGFADEPESPQALTPLLKETEKVLLADCSAIFIQHGIHDYKLLASSDENCQEELTKSIKQISNEIDFGQKNTLMEINDPFHHDSHLICMQLQSRDEINNHVLLIRRGKDKKISEQEASQIQTICNGFAGILGCAHKAQANRRIALYEERAVIARELHDSLAQSLSYLKIQTGRLQKILNQNPNSQNKNEIDIDSADAILGELRTNIDLAYAQLRELITTFRLTMNGRTLRQALRDSADEFENKSSVAITLDNRLFDDELSVEEEMHVLQIVRESLSNIVRHAMASHAEIYIYSESDGRISLIVDDDGIGIDEKRPPEHHQGLIIMQQRARSLGGEMTVMRSPTNGTRMKTNFVTRNKNI